MPTKKEASRAKTNRSCRTKQKLTELAANVVAAKMNKKGKYVKPYLCPTCKGWHICGRNKESVLMDLFKKIENERKKGIRTVDNP